jgi:homoserine dehydrogenase
VQDDAVKALRAVHSRFYLSETPIGVVLVGPGLVGATFLNQLKEQLSTLMEEFNIDLQLMGIASSKEMHCDPRGINFHTWKEVRSLTYPCNIEREEREREKHRPAAGARATTAASSQNCRAMMRQQLLEENRGYADCP